MLQMLGHVKRRTEHLIGALDQAKRRTEHLIGALDQGRGQTDGAADVAALCLSWRRSVGARYGARLRSTWALYMYGTKRYESGTKRYETVGYETVGKGRAPTTRPPPPEVRMHMRASTVGGNRQHGACLHGFRRTAGHLNRRVNPRPVLRLAVPSVARVRRVRAGRARCSDLGIHTALRCGGVA